MLSMLSRSGQAALLILAVAAPLGGQMCRGVGFPDGAVTAVTTGAAKAPGAVIPTLGVQFGAHTRILALFPVTNTWVAEIYKGGHGALGSSFGYAFGFPAPDRGPGTLGLCVTPFVGVGMVDTSHLANGENRGHVGGGMSFDVGYAMDHGENTLVPFGSVGVASHTTLRSSQLEEQARWFLDAGTSLVLRDRYLLTGKLRLNDPDFGGSVRMTLGAGINF
jgi:hypothetical protein